MLFLLNVTTSNAPPTTINAEPRSRNTSIAPTISPIVKEEEEEEERPGVIVGVVCGGRALVVATVLVGSGGVLVGSGGVLVGSGAVLVGRGGGSGGVLVGSGGVLLADVVKTLTYTIGRI